MTAAFGEEAFYAPINVLCASRAVRVVAAQFWAKHPKVYHSANRGNVPAP
jgi:hypothetical protein